MNAKNKNTILAAGIATGLLSLPMTWMTIRNAQMTSEGGTSSLFNSAFQQMTFNVTGLNGQVTLFFKSPLWFVVGFAIAANLLQLVKPSNSFAIPRPALWTFAVGALLWISFTVLFAYASDEVTLGIGSFLGLCCALAPLICLSVSDTNSPDPAPSNS